MNLEHVNKWLEALRSGRYKQVAGALHIDGGGYCCLGVACEVSGLAEWRSRDIPGAALYYLGSTGELPLQVAQWLGLLIDDTVSWRNLGYESCPPIMNLYGVNNLSGLNDRGARFLEIADVIENSPAYQAALLRGE